MIIGLTGGYCAGKNAVAAMLEARGWVNVEVDAMGHRALEETLPLVCGLLGPGARKPDGGPDRRAIGAMVFADPALMARYEAIVHPVMNRLTDEAIEAGLAATRNGRGGVFVNAALLYRLPQAERCAFIIELRASTFARLARGMRRDRLSPAAILARLRAQRPLWEAGAAWADRRLVLRNDGGRARLERALVRLLSGRGIDP